ncbi:hypothetical protein ABZ626_16740 [Streptomyces longispororuber]|uniref:hypothetical protein n=1 Tax=Streptomyces longispororuber TaxID=68230 RepID=UPI0033FE437B
MDLGTIGGRAWRLEPDFFYAGGYRMLADDTAVGAIAPVRRRKTDTVRWTAEHRRRTLGRGPAHTTRDAAARAVIAAEDAWVPLPELADETYLRIPTGLRSDLYDAALRIDLRRGWLAQIQPGAYRQQLHAAITPGPVQCHRPDPRPAPGCPARRGPRRPRRPQQRTRPAAVRGNPGRPQRSRHEYVLESVRGTKRRGISRAEDCGEAGKDHPRGQNDL